MNGAPSCNGITVFHCNVTKLHERLGKPPSCPQSRTANHDLPFSWRVYIANACNTSNKCASQTILVHANRQVTLHARIDALQAEKTALQRQLDAVSYASGKSALEYADARRKIEQLEREAREAEMVRRKLHNMVQELKGNIRVFCRVRPVLSHDLVLRSYRDCDGRDHQRTGARKEVLLQIYPFRIRWITARLLFRRRVRAQRDRKGRSFTVSRLTE